MTFPDQSHINRVRDALHQRFGNGASVMVGSGFSRNAEPIISGAREMPMWQQLVDHFYDALYPRGTESSGGNNRRPATNNVRIAQEYEAAFGRSTLHDTLRRIVPNAQHNPGSAHRKLLALPWRDVYTTNWDTLLERAGDQVNEQDYSSVISAEEIPMANRPRIVKLHGSFPAQFPLIVTEEDYRTYPTKFAPFVNTVQQSMMETVFLLIGFSGDDPNFLNWSGWVRDNLGASAPKIYLAGWFGLSPHRRRMMENHNVVPIDLAQHQEGRNWPESLRHERATEWLLRSLELGRPYDITSWPSPPNVEPDEIPGYLKPIDSARHKEPKVEPAPQDLGDPSSLDTIKEITRVWRHNRLMYPGWLSLPSFNRWAMVANTEQWKKATLSTLQNVQPAERLRFIRELVWREEILLIPTHPDLQSVIQGALDSIDCHNRTIDGADEPDENWTYIREDWRSTTIALLTFARFRFDREAFEQAVKALEPFQDEDPDLYHRLFHEQCLWTIYDRDFDLLDDLLARWKTENCDPAWMMRKAAMLWESQRNRDAQELLNNSISAMQAMPPDENGLGNLSRESWATFAALNSDSRLGLLDRLRKLIPMRCDPFQERQSVTEGMERARAEEDPPTFDINRRRGTSVRFVNYDPYAATYRAVRLSEVAGLPPFTENSTTWAQVMRQAAEEVAEHDLEFAVRLVLRACNGHSDKTLERIVTRTRVATMTTELVETLIQCCLNALEKAARDKVTPASATQQRFNTAVEVLSRLVIRLEPSKVESILNYAVDWCQDAELAKSIVHTSIRNLIVRSWEALPEEWRKERAMELLNTDLVGLGNIQPTMESHWPDPAEVIDHTSTELRRGPENETQWQSAIDLIARGLASNATARRRASNRLEKLVRSTMLKEDESLKMATALWSEQHTAEDGLPGGTDLFDWAFLTFPEPTLGLAEQRFRSEWISHDEATSYEIQRKIRGFRINLGSNGLEHDPQDVESRLWQVGSAIESLQRHGRDLTLSDSEREHLTRLVEIWAEDPVNEPISSAWNAMFENAIESLTRDVAGAVATIMSVITVSQSLLEKIHTKMQALTASHLPAFALATGLVRIDNELAPEIAAELRVGITSDDAQLATNAISGLWRWLEAAADDESKVPQPPDGLVEDVGFAIASRRNTVITPALQLATWIFNNGQDSHRDAIQRLAEAGLRYLAEELRYESAKENPDDVPAKRLYCAQLAAAMAKRGLDQTTAVARWLESAKDDPLPEVRQAVAELGFE